MKLLRSSGARVASFVGLVFLLAVPFWLAAELVRFNVLPGLPVSALMAACPVLAALILLGKDARSLLAHALDLHRLPSIACLATAVLLMPSLGVLSYLIQRTAGLVLPPFAASCASAIAMAAAFFVAAFAEELGWSGYAAAQLQGRLGVLRTGVLLGVIWAVWHIVPYLQGGRSWRWIAWQCLFTVAFRVLLVQLYSATGRSICAVALCHASSNVAVFLFPAHGSHYSPSLMFGLTLLGAALALRIGSIGNATRSASIGAPSKVVSAASDARDRMR